MVSDDEYFNYDNNIINIYDNSDTKSEVDSWVDREISSDSDIENNDIDLIWDPKRKILLNKNKLNNLGKHF